MEISLNWKNIEAQFIDDFVIYLYDDSFDKFSAEQSLFRGASSDWSRFLHNWTLLRVARFQDRVQMARQRVPS